MANFTENGHKATEVLFCANVLGLHHDIFLAAFNIFLSVTASLGNVLILIALHKESSLHPPSKLMFRCLAITDLGVGLITQPVFAAELLFDMKELRQLCNYFYTLTRGTGTVFCGVSLMTVTAISVERLIALSLGLRYRLAREVVTLKRVRAILSFVWLVSVVVSLIDRLSSSTISSKIVSAIIIVCLITSVYCYTKIFFRLRHHQVQMRIHVHQEQPNGGGIPLNIARYRKTVCAALWVQITLVACYLPRAFVRPFGSLFSLSEVSISIIVRYAGSLVYLNSSLNPFLYCWKISEVRQAVKGTVKQYCCMTGP